MQKIDIELTKRVETGALQIGEDWPGLFIRGDDCLALNLTLNWAIPVLEKHPDVDKAFLFMMMPMLKRIHSLIKNEVQIQGVENE